MFCKSSDKLAPLLHTQHTHTHKRSLHLTDSKVCVDGGVACRASQVLVLPVGDVLVRAGIAVLLGQAKVNDVHQVTLLAEAH